jgi:hypothetical protein
MPVTEKRSDCQARAESRPKVPKKVYEQESSKKGFRRVICLFQV